MLSDCNRNAEKKTPQMMTGIGTFSAYEKEWDQNQTFTL